VLVEKTINPDTGRPYTHTMLERALRDLHFNPDPKKSAKQQALEALPLLQGQFSIERARMRLKLTTPAAARASLGELLAARGAVIESETTASAAEGAQSSSGAAACSLTVQVDPGVFRDLHTFMQTETPHQGRIEVLSFAVTVEGAEGGEYAAAIANAAATTAAPRAAAAGRGDEWDVTAGYEASSSGGVVVGGGSAAAAAAAVRQPRLGTTTRQVVGGEGAGQAATSGRVVYAKGPVADLPDQFASRKERFIELDSLQPGWLVELVERGDSVDAVFYAPSGAKVGPFAAARRAALQWKQKQG